MERKTLDSLYRTSHGKFRLISSARYSQSSLLVTYVHLVNVVTQYLLQWNHCKIPAFTNLLKIPHFLHLMSQPLKKVTLRYSQGRSYLAQDQIYLFLCSPCSCFTFAITSQQIQVSNHCSWEIMRSYFHVKSKSFLWRWNFSTQSSSIV